MMEIERPKIETVSFSPNGRYGKFAACPNYPACRNTKPLRKEEEEQQKTEQEKVSTGLFCDDCGAELVLRSGRFGNFYACTCQHFFHRAAGKRTVTRHGIHIKQHLIF